MHNAVQIVAAGQSHSGRQVTLTVALSSCTRPTLPTVLLKAVTSAVLVCWLMGYRFWPTRLRVISRFTGAPPGPGARAGPRATGASAASASGAGAGAASSGCGAGAGAVSSSCGAGAGAARLPSGAGAGARACRAADRAATGAGAGAVRLLGAGAGAPSCCGAGAGAPKPRPAGQAEYCMELAARNECGCPAAAGG